MPDDRATRIAAFLEQTPAAGAERRPLAGDASPRRYERLHLPDGSTLVLMDAPPETGNTIRPFVTIARWLSAAGFSAPTVLAEDAKQGLLLLEDLGDSLYFSMVAHDPACEPELYTAATDCLVALRELAPPEGIATYDTALLTDLAALSYRWYRLQVTGDAPEADAPFRAAFSDLLRQHAGPPHTVALRDFHAQNLVWLPDRAGTARVGLLDFQDAMLAPAVYDLVSLIEDARRDVPRAVAEDMTLRFISGTGAAEDETRAAVAVVGLQRNLRILGVFARLSLHFGKPHYIDLIPRVWAHVTASLDHPVLAPVREMILADLPAPTPGHLQELKDRCGTIPTR